MQDQQKQSRSKATAVALFSAPFVLVRLVSTATVIALKAPLSGAGMAARALKSRDARLSTLDGAQSEPADWGSSLPRSLHL